MTYIGGLMESFQTVINCMQQIRIEIITIHDEGNSALENIQHI